MIVYLGGSEAFTMALLHLGDHGYLDSGEYVLIVVDPRVDFSTPYKLMNQYFRGASVHFQILYCSFD